MQPGTIYLIVDYTIVPLHHHPHRLDAMGDSTKVRLICVVMGGDDLKVRDSSFTLTVPSQEDFSGVVGYVIEATPSLKSVDRGKIRLYKPPLDLPIRVSNSLNELQLNQKHLTQPLLGPCEVKEKFSEKNADRRMDIDVIVRVDFGQRSTFFHLLVKPSV